MALGAPIKPVKYGLLLSPRSMIDRRAGAFGTVG
jgi:hypothetical protein